MTDTDIPAHEIDQLATVFEFVENIPDSVIDEGDTAIKNYVQEWRSGSVQAAGMGDVAKCAGAILVAIGSAAIPAAKLLKLKRFIKEVGSVRDAAILLLRVARGEEQLSELGPVIGSLGAEILGIDAIRKNCGK
jgi:hypothetical protein